MRSLLPPVPTVLLVSCHNDEWRARSALPFASDHLMAHPSHRLFRALVLDGLLLLNVGCDKADEPADTESDASGDDGEADSASDDSDEDGSTGEAEADSGPGSADGTGDGDADGTDATDSDASSGDGDTDSGAEDDDWDLGCDPLSTICCWVSTEGQDPDCCALCCPEAGG